MIMTWVEHAARWRSGGGGAHLAAAGASGSGAFPVAGSGSISDTSTPCGSGTSGLAAAFGGAAGLPGSRVPLSRLCGGSWCPSAAALPYRAASALSRHPPYDSAAGTQVQAHVLGKEGMTEPFSTVSTCLGTGWSPLVRLGVQRRRGRLHSSLRVTGGHQGWEAGGAAAADALLAASSSRASM